MSAHFFYALLLSFFSLWLLFLRYRWRRRKKIRLNLERVLLQVSGAHTLEISISDRFRYKIIGLDRKKKKLIYIDYKLSRAVLVNLQEVCRYKLIRKQLSIQLELVFHDQARDPLSISFYRQFEDGRFRQRMLEQKAAYWSVLLGMVQAEGLSGKNH